MAVAFVKNPGEERLANCLLANLNVITMEFVSLVFVNVIQDIKEIFVNKDLQFMEH